MKKFVVFSRPGQQNITKELSMIENLSTREIISQFCSVDEVLYITTPLFREILPFDCYPVHQYPGLAQSERPGKYCRPPYYITIIPATQANESALYLKVESQDMNVKLPDLEVVYYPDQIQNKSGYDLFEMVKQKFYFKATGVHLLRYGMEIDYNENALSIITRAKLEPLTFKCIIVEEDMKKITLRINIITEIHDTEITYLNILKNVLEYWQPKVTEKKLLTEEEANQVFHDFPNILQCHQTFLNQLKERGNNYDAILSEVFLDFADFFKISQMYISNYANIIEVIVEKTNNKVFAAQLKELAIENPGGTGEFSSFLITPIQRIPRYILFIRELVKATPESHPDYVMLKQAAVKIENVTHEIDDTAEAAEALAKLVTLQNSFLKPYELSSPSRRLLKEIPVLMTKPNSIQAKLYIFSDLVLVTSIEKKGETVVYDKEMSEFKYWSSYPTVDSMQFLINCKTLSLTSKGKIKEMAIKFSDVEQMQAAIDKIEETRFKFYERLVIDLSTTMLFKNCMIRNNVPLMFGAEGVTFGQNTYIFGGRQGCYHNSMLIYNHIAGTINALPTNIPARIGHTMTYFKENIYLFGGRNDKDFFNDLWVFSCINSQWTQIKSKNTPEPRCCHTAILSDMGEIVIFGGYDKKKKPLNSTLIYDIKSKSWEEVRKSERDPEPRAYHSASYYDGKMIVYGGVDDKTIFNDVYSLTLSNQKWKKINTKGDIITKRYMHRSIIVQSYMVVVGGFNETETVDPITIDLQNYTVTNIKAIGNNPPSLGQFVLAQNKEDEAFIVFGGITPDQKVITPNFMQFVLPQFISNGLNSSSKKRKITYDSMSVEASTQLSGDVNLQLAHSYSYDKANIKEMFSDPSSTAQPLTPPSNESQSSSGVIPLENTQPPDTNNIFNMFNPTYFQTPSQEAINKEPTSEFPATISNDTINQVPSSEKLDQVQINNLSYIPAPTNDYYTPLPVNNYYYNQQQTSSFNYYQMQTINENMNQHQTSCDNLNQVPAENKQSNSEQSTMNSIPQVTTDLSRTRQACSSGIGFQFSFKNNSLKTTSPINTQSTPQMSVISDEMPESSLTRNQNTSSSAFQATTTLPNPQPSKPAVQTFTSHDFGKLMGSYKKQASTKPESGK